MPDIEAIRTYWEHELGDGVWLVETASHGGVRMTDKAARAVPAAVRRTLLNGAGWAEEDCEASIVLAILEAKGQVRLDALAGALGHHASEVREARRKLRESARRTAEGYEAYRPALEHLPAVAGELKSSWGRSAGDDIYKASVSVGRLVAQVNEAQLGQRRDGNGMSPSDCARLIGDAQTAAAWAPAALAEMARDARGASAEPTPPIERVRPRSTRPAARARPAAARLGQLVTRLALHEKGSAPDALAAAAENHAAITIARRIGEGQRVRTVERTHDRDRRKRRGAPAHARRRGGPDAAGGRRRDRGVEHPRQRNERHMATGVRAARTAGRRRGRVPGGEAAERGSRDTGARPRRADRAVEGRGRVLVPAPDDADRPAGRARGDATRWPPERTTGVGSGAYGSFVVASLDA